MQNSDKTQQARLRWHCRRGMLELDAMLIPFFDQQYQKITPEQQQAFAALLDEEDNVLFAWLMGHEEATDYSLTEIIELIRYYAKTRDRS